MTEKQQSRIARRKQLEQKKKKKKPLWKTVSLIIGIIILAIAVGVGSLFTYYIATAPKLDAMALTDAFSSKYYDQDGELIGDFAGDEKRTKVEYSDLPDVLIDAVTATEDVRFFSHPGIDVRRIGGAIKANITRGFGAEGASTITQQVIEKSFLTPDKKLKLKVQEQWLALKLEREYSKEQIMEMYLNKIFYGSHAYGVAEASKIYFGKSDLHDLTLVEAAMLAGLPQRPSAYNPYENPDLMAGRVDTVLKLMVRHGKITQEEADEAREEDISSLLAGKKPHKTQYSAFIQQVEKEVKEKLDGADIYADGLKIYTTLDTNAQDYVEFLLSDSEDNPIKYPDDKLQTGLTLLDTTNGAIRAIGGGRNYQNGTNHATQNKQQLGSVAKPLVSFAPAIEYNKISTYHQIHDDKDYEVGGSTPIRNWTRKNHGWVSARYALQESLNIPTVKLLDEVGYDNARKFGEGLGLKFHDDKVNVRDAIGGTETRVTPLQVAGAYRAFGNEGIYNEPYAVTKVEFPDGKVVDLKPKPKAAMADYTAYMITDMLRTAITSGTGTSANIPGLDVAGKTGTTTSPHFDKGSPDAWFSGYTTNYTLAVWTGYSFAEDRKEKPIPDTKIPQYVFKHLMTEISKDVETKKFEKPSSVVEIGIERGSNPAKLPSKYTPSANIVKELFVKGHEPSETSEKFDELDPVSDLTASFDEDSEVIKVDWKYDSDDDVSFEVSASIDGGQMKELSTTEDHSLEINEVESGTTYEIQVIVISKDGANKSDPKTTKVNIPDDEEETVPSVDNLNASYDGSLIDVSWSYDGPSASFEVDVNGQKQTVQSNGIEITGVKPGQTYTITVTPIGKQGATKDVKGESRSVTESIPAEEEPDPEPEPDPDPDNNESEPDPEPDNDNNNEEDSQNDLNNENNE